MDVDVQPSLVGSCPKQDRIDVGSQRRLTLELPRAARTHTWHRIPELDHSSLDIGDQGPNAALQQGGAATPAPAYTAEKHSGRVVAQIKG